MGLLQHQVVDVLHSISHSFEMPSSLLSHNNDSYTIIKPHHNHHHDNRLKKHDHKLIDLVGSIIETSNQNHNSEDLPLQKLKVKKLLVLFNYKLPKKFTKKSAFIFDEPIAILQQGHSKRIEDPPIQITC